MAMGTVKRLIARFRKGRREPIVVATKIGRRAPLDLNEYTPENLASWIDRSRANLEVDRLDLVQLHCLPTDIYYRPEIFAAMDGFVRDGRIASYGVSGERVEEGLKAIEYPNVGAVQIIFNIFRQRPAERFLTEARDRNVGVIARVPLASGLLTGKFSRHTLEEGKTRSGPLRPDFCRLTGRCRALKRRRRPGSRRSRS